MGMQLSPELERKVMALAATANQASARLAIRTPGPSEKEFQAELVRYAKRLGWLAYHTHDSRKSEAGFWDTTLIRGPVLIGAELKVGDGKPTGPQLTWLEALAGVEVVQSTVWRPEMWPEIERVLRGEVAR